jgi:hypothetical protein
MLGASKPGYRQQCRYARKGCTCFRWFNPSGPNKARARKAARQAERAALRREEY